MTHPLPQQGDVSLFQTVDDGDISVISGVVEMNGGLETMAYLCLFGGNFDDDGSQDSTAAWWGNLDEEDPARKYVSETQNLMAGLATNTANLQRLQDAAERDLAVFLTENIASSVDIVLSMPAVNRVDFFIKIDAFGQEFEFTFTQNWEDTTT